jgi:hypothetical protein
MASANAGRNRKDRMAAIQADAPHLRNVLSRDRRHSVAWSFIVNQGVP